MTGIDRGSADASHCQRLFRVMLGNLYIHPPLSGVDAYPTSPPAIYGSRLGRYVCQIWFFCLVKAHTSHLAGKSILRDTKHMTEEPRSLNSASSPFLLMDPTVLRTFTTSRSTTDVRALRNAPNGNGHPYNAGAQNGGGKNTAQVKTTVPPIRNCEANQSLESLRPSHAPTLPYIGTQTDQDVTDAEARKNVMKDLMKSWMDRLQLISVIVGAISSRLIIL